MQMENIVEKMAKLIFIRSHLIIWLDFISSFHLITGVSIAGIKLAGTTNPVSYVQYRATEAREEELENSDENLTNS